MQTIFSATWSDKLGEAIKARSVKPYPIECHSNSSDFRHIVAAVNQGIDSHLEAIQFTEFTGQNGLRGFRFEPQSVPVLVRRLFEMEAYEEENTRGESPDHLASGICETLGIELI